MQDFSSTGGHILNIINNLVDVKLYFYDKFENLEWGKTYREVY